MRRLFTALLLLLPLSLPAQLTKVVDPLTGAQAIAGVRFVRWTILERRGAANSVQASDFSLWNAGAVVQGWSAQATATNPEGGLHPAGEEPAKLLDLTVGASTKWLSPAFAAREESTRGRAVVIIDNGEPLRPVAGYTWWTANDHPERDPVEWLVDVSADGMAWVRFDSVRYVPTLARQVGAINRRRAEEVIIPPNLPAPVVVRTCAGAPLGFVLAGGTATHATRRTERTEVYRGSSCAGVITLASASRYAAHVRVDTGWMTRSTTYTSRAAAVEAILAAQRLIITAALLAR